jgi:pimeloyl-ACP methyl ester carboxylesterase
LIGLLGPRLSLLPTSLAPVWDDAGMTFVDESSRIVAAGGQKTRLYEAGSGPPVVVLHGWGGRIESMAPVLTCLSNDFRVLALDLPGFGQSPVPDGVWGTGDYAAFVRDVLADAGVERAHFVGHSFGAKTSLYLSGSGGRLVDKLVAVGSPGLRSSPSTRVRMKRLAGRAARLSGYLGSPGRSLRKAIYERIASDDYKDAGPMRPILVKVVNEDFAPLLPQVQSPTLLVWGTEDDAVPAAHARIMEGLIPDAGVVLFEGAGHFAYLDQPDRFCRIVGHFLGRPNV